MHVLLLGKSEKGLRSMVAAIREEASKRGAKRPKLYIQRFYISSLDSAQTAANQCEQLAHSKYDGKLHVCIHHASVGSAEAKLTADGFEYNTGCNFLTTHYLTKKWMPLLLQAATPSYKPRVVCTSSIGHCLGHNFDPQRLARFPKEGGAPVGYIVPLDDERISEAEPGGIPFTTAEKLAAVAKVGTQVGRSKMAGVADVMHWAKLYPRVNFISYYSGSIATPNHNGGMPGLGLLYQIKRFVTQFSPSQGARSALRAALDPDFNNWMQGAYLHVDGNPWTPMHPSTIDPQTQRPYTMECFAEACYNAAETVLVDRFAEMEMEQQRDTYEPPELISQADHGGANAISGRRILMDSNSYEDQAFQETSALVQHEEDSWGTWVQEYTPERVK